MIDTISNTIKIIIPWITINQWDISWKSDDHHYPPPPTPLNSHKFKKYCWVFRYILSSYRTKGTSNSRENMRNNYWIANHQWFKTTKINICSFLRAKKYLAWFRTVVIKEIHTSCVPYTCSHSRLRLRHCIQFHFSPALKVDTGTSFLV